LHDKYCIEDVAFEEIGTSKTTDVVKEKSTDIEQKHKEFVKGMSDSVDGPGVHDDADLLEGQGGDNAQPENTEAKKKIDPMNREEVNVRDYVTEEGFKEGEVKDEPRKTSFEQPKSWGESFSMPGTGASGPGGSKQNKIPKDDKKAPEEPINPSFNDMSSGRKKRSTKKFAKYIVEAVCMVGEYGFIWWTTKDINEIKLAEYEVSGEFDLTVLFTLETGQEVTAKQWFKDQCFTIDQLAKFDQEEKDDMAAVLAEVLESKGFAPTAEQELMIIAFKAFGQKALMAYGINKGIQQMLSQLKTNKAAVAEEKAQAKTHTHTHTETKTTTDTDTGDNQTAEEVGNPALSTELTTTN